MPIVDTAIRRIYFTVSRKGVVNAVNGLIQVFAYEPMQQVYECLELNVKDLPVQINFFALGSVNDKVTMEFDKDNTGNSYVSDVGTGNITIKRMDDLNLPKFGLLKIDCERHELEVLKGATETILKYKPIINLNNSK